MVAFERFSGPNESALWFVRFEHQMLLSVGSELPRQTGSGANPPPVVSEQIDSDGECFQDQVRDRIGM